MRYALRMLARSPGNTLLSVLILAFGVTAAMSAFSVLRAVALDPLPYEEPGRLYEIRIRIATLDFELTRVDLPMLHAWRDALPSITFAGSNEARHETTMYLSALEVPARTLGAFVSLEYFDVLGVRVAPGRTFDASDAESRVAVITDRLRRRIFTEEGSSLGRVIQINGEPHEVVGVLPAGVDAPRPVAAMDAAERLDVFVPARESRMGPRETFDRVFVRLGPLDDPVSVAAFLSDLYTPEHSPLPVAQGAPGVEVRLAPMVEVVLGDSRTLVRILGLVVAMTLLLTFASLVLVQSARVASRRREASILAALGASRRQLITTYSLGGLALAAAAGAGALIAIAWAHAGMQTLLPAGTPRLDSFRVDPALALLAISVAAGLGVGSALVPALGIASRAASTPFPRGGTATGTLHEHRWSGALIVVQIALTFSLTVGLGLLGHSVIRLYQTGAEIRNLDTVVVDVHRRRTAEGPLPSGSFFQEVLLRVRTTPGVTGATMTSSTPFRPRDYQGPELSRRIVDGAYFETVGLRLLRGRTFDDRDYAGSAPVAVIDLALAEARFPGRDPIGALLDDGGSGREARPYTVVGVVESTRHAGLDAAPAPALYVAFSQTPDDRMSVLVRGIAGGVALAAAVRDAAHAVDPDQPVSPAGTLRELRGRSEAVGQRRFHLWFLGAAGGFAALLTALAIYGTISQVVLRRTREIGVRMAFGAGRAQVIRLVAGRIGASVAAGLVGGLVAAEGVKRVLASILFEVHPDDPTTTGVAVAVVLVLAVAGTLGPVHRALTIDPARALGMD